MHRRFYFVTYVTIHSLTTLLLVNCQQVTKEKDESRISSTPVRMSSTEPSLFPQPSSASFIPFLSDEDFDSLRRNLLIGADKECVEAIQETLTSFLREVRSSKGGGARHPRQDDGDDDGGDDGDGDGAAAAGGGGGLLGAGNNGLFGNVDLPPVVPQVLGALTEAFTGLNAVVNQTSGQSSIPSLLFSGFSNLFGQVTGMKQAAPVTPPPYFPVPPARPGGPGGAYPPNSLSQGQRIRPGTGGPPGSIGQFGPGSGNPNRRPVNGQGGVGGSLNNVPGGQGNGFGGNNGQGPGNRFGTGSNTQGGPGGNNGPGSGNGFGSGNNRGPGLGGNGGQGGNNNGIGGNVQGQTNSGNSFGSDGGIASLGNGAGNSGQGQSNGGNQPPRNRPYKNRAKTTTRRPGPSEPPKASLWNIYKSFRPLDGPGLTDFQLANPSGFHSELITSISNSLGKIRAPTRRPPEPTNSLIYIPPTLATLPPLLPLENFGIGGSFGSNPTGSFGGALVQNNANSPSGLGGQSPVTTFEPFTYPPLKLNYNTTETPKINQVVTAKITLPPAILSVFPPGTLEKTTNEQGASVSQPSIHNAENPVPVISSNSNSPGSPSVAVNNQISVNKEQVSTIVVTEAPIIPQQNIVPETQSPQILVTEPPTTPTPELPPSTQAPLSTIPPTEAPLLATIPPVIRTPAPTNPPIIKTPAPTNPPIIRTPSPVRAPPPTFPPRIPTPEAPGNQIYDKIITESSISPSLGWNPPQSSISSSSASGSSSNNRRPVIVNNVLYPDLESALNAKEKDSVTSTSLQESTSTKPRRRRRTTTQATTATPELDYYEEEEIGKAAKLLN